MRRWHETMALHLKRRSAPKTWPVSRKTTRWVMHPVPSGHSLSRGMPLTVVLRDMLGLARVKRDVLLALHLGTILVDGKRIRESRSMVGLFDVLSIPAVSKVYRMIVSSKGKLSLVEVNNKNEAEQKVARVIGKRMVRGKLHAYTHDGRTFAIPSGATYAVGDSLLVNLPDQKILDHYPLSKGNAVYLAGGKHVGHLGVVDTVIGTDILFRDKTGVHKTLKEYAYVVGREKPAITLVP